MATAGVAWKVDPVGDAGVDVDLSTVGIDMSTRTVEALRTVADEVLLTRQHLEGAGSGKLRENRAATKNNFRAREKARYTFANRGLPMPGYTGHRPQGKEPAARDPHLPDILHAVPGYAGHKPGTSGLL